MKAMLRDALILFVITLIAGTALGAVYTVTKTPIAQAEERAQQEAFAVVFSDAATFTKTESALEDATEEAYPPEWRTLGYGNISVTGIYFAEDSAGELLGEVLLVTTKEGYGGDISFAMGIRKDGTLNGISILDISETAGLGMKAPDVLVPQFANKNVSAFTVTKTGAAADSEIDAISGATITSKAVTNAVNAGLYYFETKLGGESNAEP